MSSRVSGGEWSSGSGSCAASLRLLRIARAVVKSTMKARIYPQLRSARGGCAAAPSAPAGPYLGAAEGAQQWVDLVDSVDKQAQLSRARRAQASSDSSRLRASRPAALPCSASRRSLPRAASTYHPQVRTISCQGSGMIIPGSSVGYIRKRARRGIPFDARTILWQKPEHINCLRYLTLLQRPRVARRC